jgi:tRNA nucleotidyltransferase/poly(A) polymerase
MPKLYKVGGCIRDEILGLHTKDIDFTFVLDSLDGTVEDGFNEMKTWMQTNNYKIHTEHPDKFTIRGKFPLDHQFAGLDADFVLARKETGYVEGTRTPILELGTLEDDLMRRDFTLNAMAQGEDGVIIDLFGGMEDLKNKMLKTPLDPKITLMDDPLRIMRALRFSITKGFDIHPNIYQAMEQPEILEKLKVTVSAERIRDELFRMLAHDTPKTIRRLEDIDQYCIPGFLDLVFGRGLWLKPTFEKPGKP